MELNAEMIKKALECCTSPDGDGTCLLCPYGDINLCTQSLMAHALALITSHEQRIKEQCKTAKKLRKQLKKANRGVRIFANRTKQLTEENERLRDNLERTEKALITCDKAHNALFTDTFRIEAEARADTVREMQERLKEHLEKPEFPWDSFTVAEEVIDQIAKEMLEGEKNERKA